MEDIYRSAPMALVQLYIHKDVSRHVMAALGSAGLVQFRDLNADLQGFQRSFVPEIRAINDSLRRVGQCAAMARAQNLEIEDSFMEETLGADEVNELMDSIASTETKLAHLYASYQQMESQRDALMARRDVLQAASLFYGGKPEAPPPPSSQYADDMALLEADDFEISDTESTFALGGAAALEMPIIAGTIPRKKYPAFEKLAWRATRGNLYMANYPVENRNSAAGAAGGSSPTDVFIAYSHSAAVAQRIRRIAEALDCSLVETPLSAAERDAEILAVNAQLSQVFTLLDSTTTTLDSELRRIAQLLPGWAGVLAKEKQIYDTLNLLNYDQQRRSLIGEGWVPRQQIEELRDLLQQVTQQVGATAPTVVHEIYTGRKPPTFHRTNKVTSAFQAIVDVYGVATYQETNPALPAVVTFPFMFAVMFGDIGHGIILACAALSLVLREKTLAKLKREEIFDMAFGGRYVLLFMGLLSIYTGLLYNDIFSKSMTIFKSGWTWPEFKQGETLTATFDHPYPLGLDPKWHGASNNLLFTNSYKMKMSILMGFAHMTYSLCFSLGNAIYFNSWVDIVGNFIPSMLFLQSIFGYLCITIIYKWCVDWNGIGKPAPGLLNMLINMFLSPGTIEDQLYPGQAYLQKFLVLLALICVPWLLLFKPLYLRKQHISGGAFQQLHSAITIEDDEHQMEIHDEEGEGHGEGHGEFEFGEVMIHQVIHTIEFCLNCVSHTASYLRLWALSLAHNQLSSVLWDMTIQNAFGPTGPKGIAMVVGLFAVWFVGTVVVLVCMEGTSAMLHSLRLHWVEAMSKHFEGEGYLFQPFKFATVEI